MLLTLEDDEVVASIDDEGADLEEKVLQYHRMRVPYDELLPKEEVNVGDSWELKGDSVAIALGIFQTPSLYEEDDGEVDPFSEMLRNSPGKSIEVTLESFKEHEGAKCAVLQFSAEVAAETEDAAGMFAEDDDIEGSMEITMRFEGELLFNVEAKQFVSLHQEIEGEMLMQMDLVEEGEGMELQFEINIEMTMSGEIEESWTVSANDE